MTETGKIIVEGGGGAALAAIIQQPRQFAKKNRPCRKRRQYRCEIIGFNLIAWNVPPWHDGATPPQKFGSTGHPKQGISADRRVGRQYRRNLSSASVLRRASKTERSGYCIGNTEFRAYSRDHKPINNGGLQKPPTGRHSKQTR